MKTWKQIANPNLGELQKKRNQDFKKGTLGARAVTVTASSSYCKPQTVQSQPTWLHLFLKSEMKRRKKKVNQKFELAYSVSMNDW